MMVEPERTPPKAGMAAYLLRRLEAALGGVCAAPNTGCTPSVAIATGLARGLALRDAVREAKDYLHGALAAGAAQRIGQGRGPVHHFHRWWSA